MDTNTTLPSKLGHMKMKPAVILLAAGASTRLGSPKQLIKRGEISFVRYFSLEALKISDEVWVILGAPENRILKEIENLPIHILYNNEWENGMGSSISRGVKAITVTPQPKELLIIMVCDQPYVHSGLLKNLYDRYYETSKPIIASEYQNILGTPVLFHQEFYPDLIALNGPSGAKNILYKNPSKVASCPFPLGHIDIDTPENLVAFNSGSFPEDPLPIEPF